MIVAELEVYHSRPVAPTRRVALGEVRLPVEPPPGFGGVLLGGIVARHIGGLDPDLVPDLARLMLQLEQGSSVPQPRLRYRFQYDRVGLLRSTHRLVAEGDALRFAFDGDRGTPTQQLLGAVYAAGELPARARAAVMGSIRRAMSWDRDVDADLIAVLAGFAAGASWSPEALHHPVQWALDVLGFGAVGADRSATGRAASNPPGGRSEQSEQSGGRSGGGAHRGPPSRREIQRRYRRLLIAAHPDHGGRSDAAAQRIADLSEARRILLG